MFALALPELDARALRTLSRAVADLRRGDLVHVAAPDGQGLVVAAAELVTAETAARLAALSRVPPVLLVTPRRAAAMGIAAGDAGAVILAGIAPELAPELADPSLGRPRADFGTAAPRGHRSVEAAALELAKAARLLPTVLAVSGGPSEDMLSVPAASVFAYRLRGASDLLPVTDARVPLEGAEDTRLYAFRPVDGGREHLAVVIGDPPRDAPVLARLHSECLTGDFLGSLRCDCGDQLRGAIAALQKAGGGVLLYLAQEGRGIGLVNKLRAYRLQDDGFDTLDANEALGFDADERVYLPAASMLRGLGFSAVRLMTNNPDKVEQLRRWGIEVTERVPHAFPANGHNEAYLRTKAARSGHFL